MNREIKKYIENTNPEKHWKELKMVNTTLIGGTYQY